MPPPFSRPSPGLPWAVSAGFGRVVSWERGQASSSVRACMVARPCCAMCPKADEIPPVVKRRGLSRRVRHTRPIFCPFASLESKKQKLARQIQNLHLLIFIDLFFLDTPFGTCHHTVDKSTQPLVIQGIVRYLNGRIQFLFKSRCQICDIA